MTKASATAAIVFVAFTLSANEELFSDVCRIRQSRHPIACNHARDDAFGLISGTRHPFKEFDDKNGG